MALKYWQAKPVRMLGNPAAREVDLQAKEPIILAPFYVWRIGGIWHFLPNPTVVSTWYQAVPSELRDNFAELGQWYAQAEATSEAKMPRRNRSIPRLYCSVTNLR